MLISSPQNPRVKSLLGLRERKGRARSGLLLVEGYDELALALAGGRAQEVYFCPALWRDESQRALLRGFGEKQQFEVSESVFHKIAYRQNPDGWLATFALPALGLAALRLPESPLLLVSEGVEKPGNLGAMLRTADAAGVSALISCDPLADWGNPNVVRNSKGALFTVQVAQASSAETLDWLRGLGVMIVAATPEADTLYTQADLRGGVALVVGTEHAGLSALWRQAGLLRVRLPMLGKVNSLNVATAAALLLYEALRQRG